MSIKNAVLALLVVFVSSAVSTAANTVSWAAGSPTASTGKITGSGTYTTDAGWIVGSLILTAVPTGGGMAYTGTGLPPAGGNWGPVQITPLPAGQYTVFATIGFRKGTSTMAINSPTAIINVP